MGIISNFVNSDGFKAAVAKNALTSSDSANVSGTGPISEMASYIQAKQKMTEDGQGESVKMAKGGLASKRADGIAQRGKTRGKMC